MELSIEAANSAVGNLGSRQAAFVQRLRPIALSSLARMYVAEQKRFMFTIKRINGELTASEASVRYTAISLIGLACENPVVGADVMAGASASDVCASLLSEAPQIWNLGDLALIFWAACALRHPDRWSAFERMRDVYSGQQTPFTVEAAWTLAATCMDSDSDIEAFRSSVASNLLESWNRKSGLFPHVQGRVGVSVRSHVTCFADLVYPIHALSHYHRLTGTTAALEAASRCGAKICELQGDAGQWWWHYDYRTGNVIESYPVYAIHQDAMGPMALRALAEAGGKDFLRNTERGLDWLESAPELGGSSLVDDQAGLIWRKVARREPNKMTRTARTISTRLHPKLRMSALDSVFKPTVIDYEDRPYHLGWYLYAWRSTESND